MKKSITKTALILALVTSVGGLIATSSSANTITLHAQQDNSLQTIKNKVVAEQMIYYIESNKQQSVAKLVNSGLDINTAFAGDGTALIMAVMANNKAMAEYLISLGADINQPSIGDGNPLIAAVMTDNSTMVKYILQQGADINAVVPGDETALINATHQGNFTLVKYLVEKGADVNLGVKVKTLTGSEYRSPLNRAANKQIKSYLLAQGATI